MGKHDNIGYYMQDITSEIVQVKDSQVCDYW